MILQPVIDLQYNDTREGVDIYFDDSTACNSFPVRLTRSTKLHTEKILAPYWFQTNTTGKLCIWPERRCRITGWLANIQRSGERWVPAAGRHSDPLNAPRPFPRCDKVFEEGLDPVCCLENANQVPRPGHSQSWSQSRGMGNYASLLPIGPWMKSRNQTPDAVYTWINDLIILIALSYFRLLVYY